MARLKVTYFDFPGGRGEELRLALAIAGVAFDDNRVDHETFSKMKAELPFASLPVLEVENHGVFGQTNTILRLIGQQHGLHPTDPFEAARHDAIMDAVEDLRHVIMPTNRIEDAAEKKAARLRIAADVVPLWGQCIERQIGAGPFVGGAQPSVADIKLYMMNRWIGGGNVDDIPADSFDTFPLLKGIGAGIASHPAVQAWYATDR
jgi:glutathione S-transferase